MTDPDRELARRAGAGDPAALGDLYERYKSRLLGLLVRLVGSRTLAEDVFQEVWIKVMRGIADYRPTLGTFRAWLFRVAGNAAVDRLRRERKHRSVPLEDEGDDLGPHDTDRFPSTDPGPDRTGEARILAGKLGRALQGLPEQQRLTILLRHQQGFSYAEIAAALGIPEGTAKTSVHRGVLELRRRLGRQVDG